MIAAVAGVVAAAAVFAWPDGHGLSDEGHVFANRVRAARDAAVADGRPVRLWIAAGGYGFDEQAETPGTARAGGPWVAMPDQALRPARWRPGTRATVTDPSGRVRVVFDAAGRADRPRRVSIARDGAAVRVAIGADGGVRVDE